MLHSNLLMPQTMNFPASLWARGQSIICNVCALFLLRGNAEAIHSFILKEILLWNP
ncbi:hypothetical protein [Helicobacter sp. MIT 05-5294]|uniref:hypothetical protein n=1 Tax=Helicobacter sp. MIT 05-5294 TaxID=1548150 RepID=UPI001884626B|nr:hypothetical protein [Helicobacter sp. MIT 05-5294]